MPYPRQPTARYPLDLLLVITFSNVQIKERERERGRYEGCALPKSSTHWHKHSESLCKARGFNLSFNIFELWLPVKDTL